MQDENASTVFNLISAHALISTHKVNYVSNSKFLSVKIVINFLSINFNLCFGCSKEPSH